MAQHPETCSNCKFFLFSKGWIEGATQHECRRYPLMMRVHTGDKGKVSVNDWCGEWKPKGDSLFGVAADWLEERGYSDAAQDMRTSLL